MNLEDQIRSSARGQSNRYRPADELLPRVEHRRKQRAARRMTASAVAAVVLFGGGALAVTSLRDRDDSTTIANSTEVTTEPTPSPTTTTPPATTTVTTSPTVTPTSVATTAANESLPDVGGTIPVQTPPVDDAPMPTANADGSTGIEDFWNVGSWGSEPVFGSGCGASGGIGDTIPDGLWAGYIIGDGSDGRVEVDLLCIYSGAAAQNILAGTTATTINADPNYLIVNNSTRARSMPMAANISLRLAQRDASGRCLDKGIGRSTTQWADIPANRQVWVRIHGGVITWILADCPPQ